MPDDEEARRRRIKAAIEAAEEFLLDVNSERRWKQLADIVAEDDHCLMSTCRCTRDDTNLSIVCPMYMEGADWFLCCIPFWPKGTWVCGLSEAAVMQSVAEFIAFWKTELDTNKTKTKGR